MTLLCLTGSHAYGQTFTTLGSLNSTTCFDGQEGLTLSGSTLFGTTEEGGIGNGNIFSIKTDGSGFHNLLSFSGSMGNDPHGTLALSGSTLYGVTPDGGTGEAGLIFRVNTDGSGYQSLFLFGGTNGGSPRRQPDAQWLNPVWNDVRGRDQFLGPGHHFFHQHRWQRL